ncbi:hypothetical protein [Cupriavidus sp. 2SB]|uniref:hypothetical protein n=1 Tax=Cupriavidus sp. 2SB TaxID=2502199 RepID=UPI0010F8D16B|nr:hypothetical protein [Cupriavidus sp. 2SB]
MAMVDLFVSEFRQLQAQATKQRLARTGDAARLRRKVVRKEIGMAIVALGAMAMFLDAARGLTFLAA